MLLDVVESTTDVLHLIVLPPAHAMAKRYDGAVRIKLGFEEYAERPFAFEYYQSPYVKLLTPSIGPLTGAITDVP